MPTITTEPATADRWDDAVATLTGGGDGKTCWCQWWYLPNKEWEATTVDDREKLLRHEVTEGPPRALIAYSDGTPAGWCRIAPRVEQPRLRRAKVVGGSDLPFDDESIWAITCLVVRREHRRTGIGHAMIDAALEFARTHGATAVEGYPVDVSGSTAGAGTTGASTTSAATTAAAATGAGTKSDGTKPRTTKSPNSLYHGTLDMFLRAGFREVGRAMPARPTVRLDLADD